MFYVFYQSFFLYEKLYITSHLRIGIDVKTIIIGHVFIQMKFCVRVGREQKGVFHFVEPGQNLVLARLYELEHCLNNKYNHYKQLLPFYIKIVISK